MKEVPGSISCTLKKEKKNAANPKNKKDKRKRMKDKKEWLRLITKKIPRKITNIKGLTIHERLKIM